MTRRFIPIRAGGPDGMPPPARTAGWTCGVAAACGLLLAMGPAFADPPIPTAAAPAAPPQPPTSACGTIAVDSDIRITLKAHPQVATRVSFPSPIADVSNSAPALWDDFAAPTGATSLWVRPKTTSKAGATVGVSILAADGRGYDFVFEISDQVPDTSCWTIRDTRSVAAEAARQRALDEERAALAAERRRLEGERQDQRRQAAGLDRQNQARTEALADTAARQARDAISAFKYSVNTAYAWGYSKVPPPFEVQAAFDDGRNTYVRIGGSARGVPAVVGVEGDQVMVLNYTYDDLTGVYTIQGLHDRLELRFAGILARVERRQ